MEKYGFFNSIDHDRVYDAADVARWIKKFFTNGIFNNSLKVTANDNMTVSISTGQANIEGYGYELDEALTFDISDADSILSRIDSVVLRLDLSNRQIKLQVLEGNYATTPSQPSIVRSGNIYDLRLANISVPTGATRITTDMITDTRFTSDCGNVVGAVQQIDTTDIFNQYQTMFNNWFDEIKTQLDGDVAGNLENQIIDLENKTDDTNTNVGDLSDLKTTDKSSVVKAINESNDNITRFKNLVGDRINAEWTTGKKTLCQSFQYAKILIFTVGTVGSYNYSTCVAMPFGSQFGSSENDYDGWRTIDTIKLNFIYTNTPTYITIKINSFTELEIVNNPSDVQIRGIIGIF